MASEHSLPLRAFEREYTCIAYDRRETGQPGGRIEQLTWAVCGDYWRVHLEPQPPDHIGDRIFDFVATGAGSGVNA
jgi:hypothetical protein